MYVPPIEPTPTEPGSSPGDSLPLPASFPPSIEESSQLVGDKSKIEEAIDHIQKLMEAFDAQLAKIQTEYETVETAHKGAQTAVSGCADPLNKSQATAALNSAQTALTAVQKALKAIPLDPHMVVLKQKLTAAKAALQTFTTGDAQQGHTAIGEAREAEKNAHVEIKGLNKVLRKSSENLTTAHVNIQAALDATQVGSIVSQVRDYDILVIDGVTCSQLTNGLIFPSGGLQGWGSSEAMGNWMRDALKNGDTKLFQSLLNSYFHLCRQAPPGQMGLMPWCYDQSGNMINSGSATDADEDIISTLIDAVAQNPNLTMTDTDGTTMKVSDMLKTAIANFTRLDCGSPNGLTGGSNQWQLTAGFTDYFDPTALTKMMNYCKANGMPNEASTLSTSMTKMMKYVQNELNANNGLPAVGGDGSCAIPRLLYRLTEFIMSPLSEANPELRQEALATVQKLLTQGFATGAIKINGTSVTMTTPGSFTLGGAQASAPLFMAMVLLNGKGLLPPSLEFKIPTVKAAFNYDMNNQFKNIHSESPSNYNHNGDYFGLTLGILCESLLKEYSS